MEPINFADWESEMYFFLGQQEYEETEMLSEIERQFENQEATDEN